MRAMGRDGLAEASELAVLNANYLKARLKATWPVFAADRRCKHEFVLSASRIKEEYGVSALDVAKRLIDYGIHPPTVYFPLIVPEALMIEPAETECKETLDRFVEVMETIASEAKNESELLTRAPSNAVIRRVDEVLAARKPVLRHRFDGEAKT
jgi:glycine dehydrogenase subunit 2